MIANGRHEPLNRPDHKIVDRTKIRDGQVANRPIYVALAVTAEGHRDILGLWGRRRRRRRETLASSTLRAQEQGRRRRPHAGLRRVEGAARRSRRGLAANCGANVRGSPAAGVVPLRGPAGLGQDREGAQARLHRADRGRGHDTVPGIRRDLGQEVPGDRPPLESSWAEFTPLLQFDAEIRRIVCTTNSIESVNARIRKAVRSRGHFPTEQAALKCVYMAVMSLDPTGAGRKRWTMRWKGAMNAFDLAFDGRLTAGQL